MPPLPDSPELLDPQLLAEYEARYARWRVANDAAEAAQAVLERHFDAHTLGLAPAPHEHEMTQVLVLRLTAARLHLDALQLLRDHPI